MREFDTYIRMLDQFNRSVNLVSSAERETVLSKHILDSLEIRRLSAEIDLAAPLNIIDIGTGAGFPGMPIIIAHPNIRLCAVDSVNKKLDFIKILSEQLNISDRVEVIAARAEQLARFPGKREFFDVALTRAVAKMNVITEYCLPFVRIGGYFVAYKAKNIDEELEQAQNAITTLGGEVVSVKGYTLSGGEERNLVLIRKIAPTPDKYPRKPGIPAKRPL